MSISASRVLPLIALLGLLASAARGQVVRTWVATSGTENPSCSRSAPCRTFGAAVAAVDPGGEVVVLESGGYGPFTIDKSVTIVAPAGIHASIAPTSQTAIEISVGPLDVVRLVNLHLLSRGSTRGIHVTAGGSVSVEECSLVGFTGEGYLQGSGKGSISDSLFAGCSRGIHILTGTGTILRTRVDGSYDGVTVGENLPALNGVRVLVEETVVTGGSTGFYVKPGSNGQDARLTLRSSTAAMAAMAGVHAYGSTAKVWLSDATIVGNVSGVALSGGAVVYTHGNNALHDNSTDVTGTLTPYAPQ